MDFTLHPHHYTLTILEGKQIPLANSARYLGLHLDNKLNWHKHIANKQRMLDLLKKKFYRLIGPRSKLSLSNKKRVYTMIFKPAWSYGPKIWRTTAPSNIDFFQKFQNIFLKQITAAPWFITGNQLQNNLNIETVDSVIHQHLNNYFKRFHSHSNVEALVLLDDTNDTHQLWRQHQHDLLN